MDVNPVTFAARSFGPRQGVLLVPLLGGVSGGFMVPMHGIKFVGLSTIQRITLPDRTPYRNISTHREYRTLGFHFLFARTHWRH